MLRRDVRIGCAAAVSLALAMGCARAQNAAPPADKPVAPKDIKVGDVLRGQLNAIRARGRKARGATPTFQLVSEPRRLPPPGELCNLETGPVTFQIVPTDGQAAQLKPLIGKQVAVRIEAIRCAEEAGVMSEAMVTKWSLVR